jgi:hypothetical protein
MGIKLLVNPDRFFAKLRIIMVFVLILTGFGSNRINRVLILTGFGNLSGLVRRKLIKRKLIKRKLIKRKLLNN